jgi:hypothetical protein
MSGLLERIVRRRRVSASRRLGPPQPPDSVAESNGQLGLNGTGHLDTAALALHRAAPPAAEQEPIAAAGTTPAAPGPFSAAAGTTPVTANTAGDGLAIGLRERGRMRRRARYLRRLREVQLRDIGGFVVELNRFEQERPELVQAKIENAARTDAELRALERALRERHSLRELREPGIGGACPVCGAVHGSDDRFCATCGEPLQEDDGAPGHDPLEHGRVYPE